MMVDLWPFYEILEFKFKKYFLKVLSTFDKAIFLVKDACLMIILFFCRKHHKLGFKLINIHKQKWQYLHLSSFIFILQGCLPVLAQHASHNLCKLCSKVLLSLLEFLWMDTRSRPSLDLDSCHSSYINRFELFVHFRNEL